MAKSLDDLIQYLLEEIALGGNQGVTINDIAAFTSSFYHEPSDESPSSPGAAASTRSHGVTIDTPFLSKIWTWLGRHPDVSIGEDRAYNATSVAEVERQFPGYLDATAGGIQPANQANRDSDDAQQTSSATKPASTTRHSKVSHGPRLRVNDERVYQAICGHPPDTSKVSPMEFDLLSHIAAARSNGILQGDLRQATGQDKRSVPKRTDALQTKGYIIKDTVYRKGNKTSRLILKKFASGVRESVDPAPRGSTVRDVVRRIFDVMSHQNLIPQIKLAEDLNLVSATETAALVRILRRLERLKCVKRVKTATGPSATASDLKQFIQILYLPAPEDLQQFDTEDLTLDQPLQDLISSTSSADHEDTIVGFSTTDDQDEEAGTARHVAIWNPDRSMPNVVVDVVQAMGMTGLTNWDARRLITGLFVRRTMESLLHRISSQSLVVQPPHLRHLAVVRVSTVVDGVAQYLHYSWDAFRQMVENQEIDISQIPGAKEALQIGLADGSAQSTVAPPSELRSGTDQFGFPLQPSLPLQLKNGEAHFEDLIRAVAPRDFVHRALQAKIVERRGGPSRTPAHPEVRKTGLIVPSQQISQTPEAEDGRSSQQSKEKQQHGRPRKYLKGTEKFWRLQFQQARTDAGGPSATLKKGLMQDPAGLALYAQRPSEFDETLVEAIKAGLPIPALPKDITDSWVATTKNILSRQSNGVYITPRGVRADYVKHKSQIMIFKSPHLQQVDFNDRSKVHSFRFIPSMAAHSFAYRRFYPTVVVTNQPGQRPAKVGRGEKQRSTRMQKRRSSPALGVFLEEPVPEMSTACPPENPANFPAPVDASMEVTDEEPEWRSQQAGNVMPLGRASVSSTGSDHATRNSLPYIGEKLQPPQDKSGDLTGKRSEIASEHTSSPPEALSEKQEPIQNMVQLSASTPGPSLETSCETGSASVATPVEPDSEQALIAPSSAETSQHQLLPMAMVNQDHIPSSASIAAEEMATDAAAADATTLIVEEPDSPSRQGLQISPLTESEPRRNSETKATGQQHQTSHLALAPRDISKSEETQQRDQEALLVAEQNVPHGSVRPSRKSIKKRISRAKSQPDDEYTHSSESEAVGTSRKLQNGSKNKYTPGANALCRKIVLQLVSEASGIVPNDPSTLRRISGPRWQEAGVEGRPLLKAVKGAIKSLCESGKLKQVTFTFRGKSGIMLKRAVLFLPNISPLSDLVEDVKQKIIDAEPTDYIPPEWTAEGSRAPLVGKNAQRTILELDSTPPPRRRRASSVVSATSLDTQASTSTKSTTRSSTRQPSPSLAPAVSAAAGFITLKVPSLGSLPAVQLYNWMTAAPVRALRHGPPNSTPRKLVSAVAPARGRGGRHQTPRRAGRSVVWASQPTEKFPSCLDDILQLPDLKIRIEDIQSADLKWQRFACEVEAVRAWEEQAGESSQAGRTKYAFINHVVPPALYSASGHPNTVDFTSLISFDENGSEVELPYPANEAWPTFVSALQQSPEDASRIARLNSEKPPPVPSPQEAGKVRRSARPSKRKSRVENHGGNGDDDDDDVFVPQAKRRRAGIKGSGSTRARNGTLGAHKDTPKRLTRGTQYLRALPAEMIYRIAVSVIVVRTLAGGIDSYIDWSLVMTNFPNQKEEFIRRSWKTLSSKYRSDIRGLTENLQWKYLGALEAGEVVSVNFQNLGATDWPGIIGWAMRNLDKLNSKQAEDLPESREQFLDTHTLEFNEPKRSYQLLGYNANVTMPFKEDVACSIVFGTTPSAPASPPLTATPPLHFVPRYELESSDPDLRLARSWVFAAVLTPESTFNPTLAHAKLSALAPTPAECEALLTRALRVLQDEKLIQRPSRQAERVSGVRSWEGHRKLYERLEERRMINANMLRRAVKYKLDVVDKAFQMGASVVVEKDGVVDDGDLVAVLNLMATAQIRPRPGTDVPDTRYGIDHERVGYQTRNMNKKLLNFSVELVPTPTYVFGDPRHGQGGRFPIPRGHADEPRGMIPPWIDIHGNIQRGLWDMFLVSVIGLVVQLPGVTAVDLSRALGFALEQTEVELILDWCIQAGCVKMDAWSKGYETTEYWWWCIAAGQDEEEG